MHRWSSWLLIVLSFGVFTAAAVYAIRERAATGKDMPAYSMYSPDRGKGLGEAAWLLQQLGWQPVAVTQPIHHTRHRGLLILVEPPEFMDPKESTALWDWVEKGNTLVIAGRQIGNLPNLKVSIRSSAEDDEAGTLHEAMLTDPGGYTDEVDRLILGSDDGLSGSGIPLWRVGDQPAALVQRRGRGQVIIVADPSLFTGRGLRRGDNVMFLVNLADLHARDGQVLFDEYHHGLHSGGGFWGYLRYHDQQWTLLALLAVAAAAAWAVGVRLGPAVTPPEEKRADAVDYASAVARIYQQSGVRHLMAAALVRDFMTALCRHLRLRRGALPAEVLAAWRQRDAGESARQLEELLRGAAELRGGDVPERRLLLWTRAFDRFQNEVLRAR